MTPAAESEDERFLYAAAEILQEYLLSTVLFWPVPGFSQPLTPGNLLFSSRKVAFFYQVNPGFTDLPIWKQIEKLKSENRTAWTRKVDHEIRSRLTQWKEILSDIEHGDPNPMGISASVRVRTLLTLLMDEDPYQPPAILNELAMLDQRFESFSFESGFVWESRFEPIFPKDTFWYLYRKFS